MKTSFSQSNRGRDERGMATIVVMALLAIVLILVSANVRALSNLGRELKFIDHKQTEHWKNEKIPNTFASALVPNSTNSPAAAPLAAEEF